MTYSDRVRARFHARVQEGAEDECWPWAGARTKSGYGVMSGERRGDNPLRTHRVAFELHFGPVPDGLHVLHRCDNPPCCNPLHLYAGSNAQNVIDKVERGRQSRVSLPGSANPNSNLNERVVREIKHLLRADGSRGMSRAICTRYQISRSLLSAIRTGKVWQSVNLDGGDETGD